MSENTAPSRNTSLLTAGVLALALAAAVLVGLEFADDEPAAAPAAATTQAHGIVTTGTGSVTATPDELTFTATVAYSRSSTSAALAATSAGVRTVTQAAKKAGVAAEDITTTSISVNPQYRYDNDGRHLVGYGSVQRMQIVAALKDAGKVLTAVTSGGGNNVRIGSTELSLSNRDALIDQARADAVAKAKASAAAIATAAGREVGELEYVEEINPQASPYGYEMSQTRDALGNFDAGTAAGSVPISAGEQDVTVTVQVRWSVA